MSSLFHKEPSSSVSNSTRFPTPTSLCVRAHTTASQCLSPTSTSHLTASTSAYNYTQPPASPAPHSPNCPCASKCPAPPSAPTSSPLPEPYNTEFAHIVLIYRMLTASLSDIPLNTAQFLLRAPNRSRTETPAERHARHLTVISRFLDLAIADINHAESSLPPPETADSEAVGVGAEILPPVRWADNKTHLSIAMEVALMLTSLEMGLYTTDNQPIQFPPDTPEKLETWQRVREVLALVKEVYVLVKKVQEMLDSWKQVIAQPMYANWWCKMTARQTWQAMLRSKKEREYPYAVTFPGPPDVPKPSDRQSEKKRAARETLRQQQKRHDLDMKDHSILLWRDKCRGAPPPSAQVGPLNTKERAVPVAITGYQEHDANLEGRAEVPVFWDLLVLGTDLTSCDGPEASALPWWERVLSDHRCSDCHRRGTCS